MPIRRQDYDAATYARSTYGESHQQGYLQVRNRVLAGLIAESQRDDGRLRILEIACGPGLSLTHLATVCPGHVLVGVDRSAGMLRVSRGNIAAAMATPRLARATAARLPFPDHAFDIVFATRFIHMFRDKSVALKELRRVLRPGGVLAVEFYGRAYYLLPFLAGRMHRPWRQFLWQHPTVGQVRALMGATTQFTALRLGGERYLRRALGDKRMSRLLRHAWRTPLRPFVAEYFAIAGKTEPALPSVHGQLAE